ncbi:energy-coupling factor transporter ATP-binding protein EcfA2 [Bacillus sp. SLBN-46]|uniref:ATP-binding protein n=1 Tax=Bacillus sp. SLBN-46 TaxID=3042283 RepID=UPI002859F091|nr:ATP-binding protein [Bacillus sp. SLBN-46]MDR6123471.1 energy-coupling factor transporter ATP-binding protein EcfA2 [Bacillus sp. SLBN-46]
MINNELMQTQGGELVYQDLSPAEQLDVKLDIIDETIRRRELSRLTEMEIAPFKNLGLPALEEDFINNVRLFKITEMVYQKGEPVTDKFTTVFNTLQTYKSSVFVVIDSNGKQTDFYLGVRSNGDNRSTVTLGDTLKNTLVGHFPGVKIENEDRSKIAALSTRIAKQHNVASVSVVGNNKNDKEQGNEQFVQGLEKLALAMHGRQFTGIIVAQNSSSDEIQRVRKSYQRLYTELSPLQKVQLNDSISNSESKSKSFFEMNGKQKAAMIAGTTTGVIGAVVGAAVGGIANPVGIMLGGQIGGTLGGLFQSLAPNVQVTESSSSSVTKTAENKAITDMLQLIDSQLKRTNEFDSYGMWNIAGYFISDDMSAAEIAASNYRSLMNGENSGREVSAINSWRSNFNNFGDLTQYLSRFVHPQFVYGGNVLTNASTAVSGKELGLHLGLPRNTVPGMPVIEHAEFGKEVNSYQLFPKKSSDNPKERITLGKVFDLGQITDKTVELDNKSLNMHTLITGSTGSGKSNTVYQLLNELHHDEIPFLVVEPAKGEYKDVFGNWDDVNVYSTNPNIAPLINLNPFKFPESIHVLEHVDGLVEIFSVCWPMYDAMPAFFKEAILKSYEEVGWDLGSSTFEVDEVEYPDFEILAEQLEKLIDETEYSAEVKGNYTGPLITRVKSLTVGLNKFIFTSEQTPYEKLFDENCILDISRVKSSETKALIMGLMVYILNEYRVDQKSENNVGLRHVTVLEEAHNLLKNTTAGGESDLIGKSVEMLTNTIAEIRTYGEGFIIVDQSPSSVDIAAIKNTNTKIVLRTPEANDREAVGRSMGLTPDQVNEIAKLPSGVAVVYQNDWISPVLTMVDKANVKESPYINNNPTAIKPIRESRTEIIRAIMEPWLPHDQIKHDELSSALNSLEVSREYRKLLSIMIATYTNHQGHIIWDVSSIPTLQNLLFDILSLSKTTFEGFVESGNPSTLRAFVQKKTTGLMKEQIDEICSVLTMEGANDGN